jgi:hypothetical protein
MALVTRDIETLLRLAVRPAPVAVQGIAVIALFAGLEHAVPAELPSADGRASVVARRVAVIAFFTALDDAVSAYATPAG